MLTFQDVTILELLLIRTLSKTFLEHLNGVGVQCTLAFGSLSDRCGRCGGFASCCNRKEVTLFKGVKLVLKKENVHIIGMISKVDSGGDCCSLNRCWTHCIRLGARDCHVWLPQLVQLRYSAPYLSLSNSG